MSDLRVEPYWMPAAEIGSRNPLPDIKTVQYVHSTVTIGEHVTEEQRKYIGFGGVQSILPYQLLDGYQRDLSPRAFKSVVLENETLRAVFLPEHGGRLWSLYHKKEQRELLHVNPVFQPCHFALRDAWFSGGVEWNVGIKGHTPYTCDPMHTEIVRVGDAKVLRMYEFERIRRCMYCIEAYLPDGVETLFVKVRIKNAAGVDTPMYWWSTVAVDEHPDLRVIVPATKALECFYNGSSYWLDLIGVPETSHGDCSYPTNLHRVTDYFYDIPKESPKWMAAITGDGKGLFETSTMRLRGRKIFQWGTSVGGRHWQEFLSHGKGAYVEIQAGLARTQLEHLPMKAGEEWSFVEAFGMISCDPKAVHGSWAQAQQAVSDAIVRTLGENTPDALAADEVFNLASRSQGEIVHLGSGWGALENLRRQQAGEAPLSDVLRFPAESLGAQQADWLSLMQTGDFPDHDIADPPESYMAQAQYLPMLESAALSGNWYALLQLGVTRYALGDAAGAREAWLQSVKDRESGWAQRNLAQLDRLDGNTEEAIRRLARAVALLPDHWRIVHEYGTILNNSGQSARFLREVAAMPETVQSHPRIVFLKAQALCRTGNPQAAEDLLANGFVLPDIREGEISIADLWQEIQREQQAHGTKPKEIPYELDFRMH